MIVIKNYTYSFPNAFTFIKTSINYVYYVIIAFDYNHYENSF